MHVVEPHKQKSHEVREESQNQKNLNSNKITSKVEEPLNQKISKELQK
jgi:hypothetical protein